MVTLLVYNLSTRVHLTSFLVMSGVSEAVTMSVPIILFTCIIVILTFVIMKLVKTKETPKIMKKDKPVKTKDASRQHNKTDKVSKRKEPSKIVSKQNHPYMLTALKGHTNLLTSGDLSPSGKYFITASQDRTVMIWNVKDFSKIDKKASTSNIEYDHALRVCWSPDSKAVIVFKAVENLIEVYKVTKKPNGTLGRLEKAISFPEMNKDHATIALKVASTGKYIMTCDSSSQVYIWDLRGKILHNFDTRHGETYSVNVSPCGRFLVTTGFTPDAKVYQVQFNKNGDYEATKRIYELKGHRSGIYNCSINSDSSKMVTVSKDGTWRLYNTNVDYQQEQEPKFLLSGTYERGHYKPEIALSPDGRSVALSNGPHLDMYSAINGSKLYTINDVYIDSIIQVMFDHSNKFVITLGEKHVKVFYNVAGYQATIQDLNQSKSKASTAAMKERIIKQIKEAQDAIASIPKNKP